MAKAYRGRLISLNERDEKAISILQLEMAERGYAHSRSAAVRLALHSTVADLIAGRADVEKSPIAVATPDNMPAVLPADTVAG